MRALAAASLALALLSSIGAATVTESDPGHVYSKGDWEALSAVPGADKNTAMAYSADDDLILLYGGRHPNFLFFTELWRFKPDTGQRLDPETVLMAEFSIELCDGRPSLVQEHLEYRYGTVGIFYPWSSKAMETG